jgi:8-oxo-dGTP pyrophosphatase MutT (NUDIX family)
MTVAPVRRVGDTAKVDAVVTDLDGTLLRSDGTLSPATAAALREAREEVGIDLAEVPLPVLGQLDPVEVQVSGFRLTPILVLAARRPSLRPDPREVAAIIEAPVSHFLPTSPIETVTAERAGVRLRYGAYPVAGHLVWGATARILGQLGGLLGAMTDEALRPA